MAAGTAGGASAGAAEAAAAEADAAEADAAEADADAAEADAGTAGSPEAGAWSEVEGEAGLEVDAGRGAGWADPGGWTGAESTRRSHTLGAGDWEAAPERGVNAGDGRWKASGREAGGTACSEERGDPAAGGSAERVPGACVAGWDRGASCCDWGAAGCDWGAAGSARGKVPVGGTALSQSAASAARPEGTLPVTGSAGRLRPAALALAAAAGWAIPARAAGSQTGSAGSQTGLAAEGRE